MKCLECNQSIDSSPVIISDIDGKNAKLFHTKCFKGLDYHERKGQLKKDTVYILE